MGRREAPVSPTVPQLARLALRLRELRHAAGSITYRAMAERTKFAHSALARAASGCELPSWELTRAFANACGGDEAEIHRLWSEADRAVQIARQESRIGGPTDVQRLPRSPQEFGLRLRCRLDEVGLSQRKLAIKIDCSATTVNAILAGRRLPSKDQLDKIGQAISTSSEELGRWHTWLAHLVVGRLEPPAVTSAHVANDGTTRTPESSRLASSKGLSRGIVVVLSAILVIASWAYIRSDHSPTSLDAETSLPYPTPTATPRTSPRTGNTDQPEPPVTLVAPATGGNVQPSTTKKVDPRPIRAYATNQSSGFDDGVPGIDGPDTGQQLIYVVCQDADESKYLVAPHFNWLPKDDVTLADATVDVPDCADVDWPTD